MEAQNSWIEISRDILNVTHYLFGDAKAWRPVHDRKDAAVLFEPEEVRDVSGEPYKYPLKPEQVSLIRRVTRAASRLIGK